MLCFRQGAEFMELLKKKAEMANARDGKGEGVESAEPLHESGGFDAPKLSTAAGGVSTQNLGVVGRGKQRINLAPSSSGVTVKPRVTLVPTVSDATKSDSEPDVKGKGKRTLDDLMGSGGGESSIGFGAPSGTSGGFFDSSAFQTLPTAQEKAVMPATIEAKSNRTMEGILGGGSGQTSTGFN